MKIDDLIYRKDNDTKILSKGRVLDYEFFIVSYGSHPCAYVGKKDLFGKIDFDTLDERICVHGGITYSSDNAFLTFLDKNLYWVGWDYCHCDDYFESKSSFKCLSDRKWTMKEIYEDVLNVVEQLIDYEKELKKTR